MAEQDRKVRAIEVAALAKASASTVSRALSGDKRISDATRERVLAAAKALNYQPNLIARGLKSNSTGIVGVVVTNIANPYHAQALKWLIDEMDDHGLAPLVFACNEMERAGAVISRLVSFQVDAVIGLAAPFDADITRNCADARKPLVLMNRYDGPGAVITVAGDGATGGALVAEHLAARGASNFGILAGEDLTAISAERERGYRERLAALGHGRVARASGAYDYSAARKAAGHLLEQRLDAVFCANDTLACALLDEARLQGRSVPGELMVVGYDNTSIAAWGAYDLTSVDHNMRDLVGRTVSTIRAMIATGDTDATSTTVRPTLVVRGSTSP